MKGYIVSLLLGAIIGATISYKLRPQPTSLPSTPVTESTKKEVITVTKEIFRPDGTKEKIIEVRDKVITKTDVKPAPKPKWSAEISTGVSDNLYRLTAGRRVTDWPVFVTGSIDTNKSIGVGIRIEF